MNRLLLSLLLLPCALPPAARAQTVDRFFAAAPTEVLPLLDRTARLDLLDLYNSRLPAKAENVLGGQTEMTRKTDSFIELKLTASSSWQLKVLPTEQDTLLLCIHSLDAGSVGSKLKVYATDWTVKTYDLPDPKPADFYLTQNPLTAAQSQMVQALLPVLPVEIAWDDEADALSYRLSTGGLTREVRQYAQSALRTLHFDLRTRQ